MPDREHTDRQALERMAELAARSTPSLPWYRLAWLWIKEDLFKAPIEPRTEDDAVSRRIHVHEWATACARRLRKLDREEAAEILVVTAMLLGFEDSRVQARRQRVR